MNDLNILRIEFGRLTGQRPRLAGCNARLGIHGQQVSTPIARITTADGQQGFGWSAVNRDQAQDLVSAPLRGAHPHSGVSERERAIEYPLLDLAAKQAGLPVYAFVADGPIGGTLTVPCYDTSLYIDDLHLADDDAGAALIAAEAAEDLARGHRAFKVKVGRGALHMPLEAGTRRDIAVIRAVRQTVGPACRLMIDANNGYNVNLAKRVLAETADLGIYWLEEPFHEDPRLYAHLKEWFAQEGLKTLIADGEGDASPHVIEWVQQGLIDVLQYDVRRPGFSRWLELGPQLDEAGVRSGPHNYGEPFGNYASCHLSTAIQGFEAVEWDEATLDGLDATAYRVAEGCVIVTPQPGFGLNLDEAAFQRAIREEGFVVEAEC